MILYFNLIQSRVVWNVLKIDKNKFVEMSLLGDSNISAGIYFNTEPRVISVLSDH